MSQDEQDKPTVEDVIKDLQTIQVGIQNESVIDRLNGKIEEMDQCLNSFSDRIDDADKEAVRLLKEQVISQMRACKQALEGVAKEGEEA